LVNVVFSFSALKVEGVSEEEEVDDQLLWNLQILSEVSFCFFLLLVSLSSHK